MKLYYLQCKEFWSVAFGKVRWSFFSDAVEIF